MSNSETYEKTKETVDAMLVDLKRIEASLPYPRGNTKDGDLFCENVKNAVKHGEAFSKDLEKVIKVTKKLEKEAADRAKKDYPHLNPD